MFFRIYCAGLKLLFLFLLAFTHLQSAAPSPNPWFFSIKNTHLFRFTNPEINHLLINAYNGAKANPELNKKMYNFLVSDDPRLSLPGFTRIDNMDCINREIIKDSLFIVFFHTDDDYVDALKKINKGNGKYFSLLYANKTRYMWVDKNAMLAYDKTLSFGDKTSHHTENFSASIHETICNCINTTKDLPGDYVEIGVYKGGSALTALHYMHFSGIKRKSYFIDTYDGFNYQEAGESADVIWNHTHGLWGIQNTMNYIRNLLDTTGENFELVAGNVCKDPLPKEISQIAVCNLDVDLYEATLAALIQVAPYIVKSGIIICEDPTSTPGLGGSLLAMEEFLQTPEGRKFIKILAAAQYLLIKIED